MGQDYWFKAKPSGYGWYPARWQGWLVTTLFIILEIYIFRSIDVTSHSVSDTLINFIPLSCILIALFMIICAKTGEKAREYLGNKTKTK